eukprot:2707230-Pyramimonas_sp.AAC.1
MCRFGTQVDGQGLNKKPTGIMSNHPHLLRLLEGRLCLGDHRHAVLEGGSVTTKAACYTPRFAQLVARA